MTGRGLHYTTTRGVYADVWQWKATSGGPTGWMDDDHFGPPPTPTPMQANNTVPYRGGFAPDPGTRELLRQFRHRRRMPTATPIVTPRRLPKDLAAMTTAMGQITLDPERRRERRRALVHDGGGDRCRIPAKLDRLIPVGTVLPGVIISGEYSGDRADVRCAARWASGHWALEVARRLDTQEPIRRAVQERRLHARRGLRSQPDQAHPARSSDSS